MKNRRTSPTPSDRLQQIFEDTARYRIVMVRWYGPVRIKMHAAVCREGGDTRVRHGRVLDVHCPDVTPEAMHETHTGDRNFNVGEWLIRRMAADGSLIPVPSHERGTGTISDEHLLVWFDVPDEVLESGAGIVTFAPICGGVTLGTDAASEVALDVGAGKLSEAEMGDVLTKFYVPPTSPHARLDEGQWGPWTWLPNGWSSSKIQLFSKEQWRTQFKSADLAFERDRVEQRRGRPVTGYLGNNPWWSSR